MTSSNGNNFRVTGHLCGEFTAPHWIPRTKASDAELWCFFDLHPNKLWSKQWWGWWFETPPCQLWRNRNDHHVFQTSSGPFTCVRVCVWLNISHGSIINDITTTEHNRGTYSIKPCSGYIWHTADLATYPILNKHFVVAEMAQSWKAPSGWISFFQENKNYLTARTEIILWYSFWRMWK